MKWEITIKPSTPALNWWGWHAVRADQENVLSGDQLYVSSEDAEVGARAAIQQFEDNTAVVRDATITVEFVPEGVVIPEEPAPEVLAR